MAVASARPSGPSGSFAPSSRTPSVNRSRSCVCSASSSTANRAATLASNGNWWRSRVQKAWMVCTLSPPGVSSARANSRRARARRAAPGIMPVWSRITLSSASSSSVVQAASVSNTRLAIFAAAALVKVIQRIFSGSTSSSSRLITRCASTWVFPEPALAASHDDTFGSAAALCRRRTSSGMASGVLIGRPRCRCRRFRRRYSTIP